MLAKAVNHLKMELRKSKHEVLSLRNQLHSSHERNAELVDQQATLFNSVEQFENHLDKVFANNSFSYVLLSTSIEQITSKNPRRSSFKRSETINVSKKENRPSCSSSSNISSSRSTQSIPTTSRKPHQSAPNDIDADILNTAFVDDSTDYEPNELPASQTDGASSVQALDKKQNPNLMKKPSRPSRLPVRHSISFQPKPNPDDTSLNKTTVRAKRPHKLIDYREQPINRKMRRIN